ncbi:11689_t:CDS:2 [Funneliformis mosseae]|uniref:11689_t:CDS:1 n=1 Tax=Funneliformis mosseae TaxID=27381 RepID=A0A9N9FCD2_FUNMO|nr:11689_t:CDS:2 [Funneliformis mosseae]
MNQQKKFEFDLFSEFTEEEEAFYASIANQFEIKRRECLAKLPSNSLDRTPEQSRLFYKISRDLTQRQPYILPGILNQEECNMILEKVLNHVSSSIPNDTNETVKRNVEGWTTSRHSAYPTTDIPCSSIPTLNNFIRDILHSRVITKISVNAGFKSSNELDFKDLFFVKYEAKEGEQSELKLHSDGCLISFNILLNMRNEFEGGGTYFSFNEKLYEIEMGDCLVHDSRHLHAGRKITKGTIQRLLNYLPLQVIGSFTFLNHVQNSILALNLIREQIDYAKLRYLLQNHEKKSSTTFDTSNILGSLDELSNQVRNLSQNEEMVEEKLENEIEEVIKEVETVEVKGRENVIELEQLREENEQLKLELQAFKRNTRPLFKSPSKGSKSTETRRNILKDKLYFKLQLGKVDELETEILANLEIMLTLRIDDVNRVVPSLEQINKVMRVVPQLRDFIMKVILLVLDNNEEINLDISSKMLPQDIPIPSEQMLKKTIETLKEWRETLKDMKLYAAQLLH